MVERKKSKKQSAKPKREANTSQLFNKVNTVSESTKALSREIKGMAKIFKDNQKSFSLNERYDAIIEFSNVANAKTSKTNGHN